MNNQHRFHLVEAERHRILGEDYLAASAYDLAIELSNQHEYLREEALSNELAAKFYLSTGKKKLAYGYMMDAWKCYLKWGATAKIRHLEKTYPDLISSFKPVLTISENDRIQPLDISTIIKASQAISSEIELEKLLPKMMKIAMENAGAQKGFLMLMRRGLVKK